MSGRGDSFPWLMVVLLILLLFAYVKLNGSELRDLQRRVGQLEQGMKR